MTQTVKETSLDAYFKYKSLLGEVRTEIYKYIVENPFSTRKEIEIGTNININSVCGRVKELLELDLIKVGESKINSITGVLNETLYAISNPNFNLLDIKTKLKKERINLNKKHIATITKIITIIKKKIKGSIEEHQHQPTIKAILELEKDLLELSTKTRNETPFFYQDLGYAILFKVNSETRENIFFDIIYYKGTKKISCSYENYLYNPNKDNYKCKHIKKVINKFKIK
jgi:hypothetical protein